LYGKAIEADKKYNRNKPEILNQVLGVVGYNKWDGSVTSENSGELEKIYNYIVSGAIDRYFVILGPDGSRKDFGSLSEALTVLFENLSENDKFSVYGKIANPGNPFSSMKVSFLQRIVGTYNPGVKEAGRFIRPDRLDIRWRHIGS
jgi:hypothetical protein